MRNRSPRLKLLVVGVMKCTEDWLEEREDKENDTDDGVRLVDLKKVSLVELWQPNSLKVTHVVHLVRNVNTQAETNNPEKISKSLARSVESDQSRKAEQANGDGAERENDDEGEASNDTVRHENALSSIHIRPATLLEGRGTAVGVAATSHTSTCSCSSSSFVVCAGSCSRSERSTTSSWVSGETAAIWVSIAVTTAGCCSSAVASDAATLSCNLSATVTGPRSTARRSTTRSRNKRVGVGAVLSLGHVQGHGTISARVLRDTGRLAVRAECAP